MGIDGTEIKRRSGLLDKEKESTLSNLVICPICQKQISKNADSCPNCGEPKKNHVISISPAEAVNNYSTISGLTGTALLAIGVFCPVISAPIVGDVNLFKNGEGDGVLILAVAFLSLLFILMKKMKFLWYSASASLIMIGFTFYQFRARLTELSKNMEADLAGNPFRGFADVAMQSVNMQWGWGILIIGCCLLFAAAYYQPTEE